MRIAYFSPLNPQLTGIADYSEELLPQLARHFELDLFVDGYTPASAAIRENFEVFDYHSFPDLLWERRYAAQLYHLGNNQLHEYIYDTLQRYPGVTVLHDHILHHVIKYISLGRGDRSRYMREMGYAHGRRGLRLARRLLAGSLAYTEFEYPLAERAIDASLGVIVHSRYVAEKVRAHDPGVPVAHIPLHFSPSALEAETPDPAELRARLGLQADQLVIASFGHLVPHKRLDVALRAFRRLREEYPRAAFLLVGPQSAAYDLPGLVQELGLAESVLMPGYVDADDFQRYLAAADICVNLRYPTAGETSASLIRMLGAGCAVIVSDVGAFSELPDECCAKVGVGPDEEDELLAYLQALARSPALAQQMGLNARRHVRAHHRLEDSAKGYADFIRRIVAAGPRPAYVPPDETEEVRAAVVDEAVALGLKDSDEAVLDGLARALNGLA